MSSIMYCDTMPVLPPSHIAIIDGKSCGTVPDFLQCIWEQLSFPDSQEPNWDAYLDWMRDLSWLKAKNISLVIMNFEKFLYKDPHWLKDFIADFEEVVFPFWLNDAESVFENQDAVKDITVYCVRKKAFTHNQFSTLEAVSTITQTALNGQKTPHSVAQPVLRMHNGKLCFAAFAFFYNREQLRSAKVNRPSKWVLGDLRTGEIIECFDCSENEFSNGDYQRLYNVSPDDILPVSEFYWGSVYALMDLIREEYLSSGTLNEMLYQEYLERIYHTTPEEYKIFYKDLSNV